MIDYDKIANDLREAAQAAERKTNRKTRVTRVAWFLISVPGASGRRIASAAARVGVIAGKGSGVMFPVFVPAISRLKLDGGSVKLINDPKTVAGKQLVIMTKTLKALGWQEVVMHGVPMHGVPILTAPSAASRAGGT